MRQVALPVVIFLSRLCPKGRRPGCFAVSAHLGPTSENVRDCNCHAQCMLGTRGDSENVAASAGSAGCACGGIPRCVLCLWASDSVRSQRPWDGMDHEEHQHEAPPW